MSTPGAATRFAAFFAIATPVANAAVPNDATGDWIPWIVLGAIGLLVAGIALKMFLSARFSKGYGAWARSNRDTFASRNAQWDNEDEQR